MASPFSIFRKHQRVMMAVLGVAAMIAFVFLGPLEELMSQRGGQDPVVATTVYGKVRDSDLAHMQYMRNLANRFMQKAAADAQLSIREEVFGEPSERSLVQTMLLANKAKQLGVVISDEFITDWLERNLDHRVTTQQYDGIVNSLKTSRLQVYEALRTELLAFQMVEMFLPGFRGGQSPSQEWAIFMTYNTTPAQRWEYFQRLKRQATVEALAVSAADYLGEIADPSDETLDEFYAEHKDAEPRPGSPDPGFKIPQKVKLDYFEADKKNFLDLASIGEQEIKDYYEENKGSLYLFDMWSRFAPKETPLEPPPDKPLPPEKPATDKPDQVPPAEKGDAPAATPPKSEAPKSEAPKSDGATLDGALRDGATDALAQPAKMHALVLPGPFPLLSAGLTALSAVWEAALTADDPPAGKAETDKKSEPKTAPSAPAAKASPAATEKPAEAKPAAEKPFAPPLSTVEPPDAFLALPTQVTVPDDDIMPLEITDFPAYLPLSYVAGSIREALAEQRAPEKIKEALDAVSAKMKRYGSDRTKWEVRRQDNKNASPPQPLDLKALAEQYKLSLHETALVAPYEASRLPGIGESYIESREWPRFVSLIFSPFPLYTPARGFDLGGDHFYLFWKTESHEARVPELAEIRGEVVRAWKMNQARDRAVKRGESLAEQARKDGRPLKAIFGDRPGVQVIETGPFSWLTQDNTADFGGNAPPTLSEVPGIIDAGNDFMHKVFDLHVGDVGVAFNNPQTIAYVIRATSFQPSMKLLEDLFMLTPLPQYSAAAAFDRQQMMVAWNLAMQKEAKLDWARDPIPGRAER